MTLYERTISLLEERGIPESAIDPKTIYYFLFVDERSPEYIVREVFGCTEPCAACRTWQQERER